MGLKDNKQLNAMYIAAKDKVDGAVTMASHGLITQGDADTLQSYRRAMEADLDGLLRVSKDLHDVEAENRVIANAGLIDRLWVQMSKRYASGGKLLTYSQISNSMSQKPPSVDSTLWLKQARLGAPSPLQYAAASASLPSWAVTVPSAYPTRQPEDPLDIAEQKPIGKTLTEILFGSPGTSTAPADYSSVRAEIVDLPELRSGVSLSPGSIPFKPTSQSTAALQAIQQSPAPAIAMVTPKAGTKEQPWLTGDQIADVVGKIFGGLSQLQQQKIQSDLFSLQQQGNKIYLPTAVSTTSGYGSWVPWAVGGVALIALVGIGAVALRGK